MTRRPWHRQQPLRRDHLNLLRSPDGYPAKSDRVEPVSSLFKNAPTPRTALEREAADRRFAASRHRTRRRMRALSLLPHACLAFLVWSVPHMSALLVYGMAISLATHVLIVVRAPPPPGRR